MARAEDIFRRLTLEGEAAIDRLITDFQSENLWLDFKRSADNGTGTKLHVSDRENLARAISGFGNSDGGVIVWGVDCRRDAKSGADLPSGKHPIVHPHRFVSWLEGAVSSCKAPAHRAVEHLAICAPSSDIGFVATLIPESFDVPHQCIQPGDRLQYYMRAGSNFAGVPHAVLSGMFGRRQKAVLEIEYEVKGWPSQHGPQGTKRTLQLALRVANRGRASLAAPFIRVEASAPFEVKRYGVSSKAHGETSFEVFPENSRVVAFVASANILLHPKMSLPFAEVVTDLWDHEPVRSLQITWAHAALDLPLAEKVCDD